MGEPAIAIDLHSNKRKDDIQGILRHRASEELVIAFMGAAGCGLPSVITECKRQLEGMGYADIRQIKLSEFIKKSRNQWEGELLSEDKGVAYLENQTGGNILRRDHGCDILAQYAVNYIARAKIAKNENSVDKAKELPRVAYLIDQIKHPDEAKLLRLVYRNLFYLVGVLSTQEHRKTRLKDAAGLSEEIAQRVMERDRKEIEKHGQHLEKAFKLADYFIQHPLGKDGAIPRQIKRFLELTHGHNAITPTRHEHAMYVAHATGLKSACFSRQVGAAIVGPTGQLLAVGCNDVPQAGGGLYSVESYSDHRCAYIGDRVCENDNQKDIRYKKIKSALAKELPTIFNDKKLGKILDKNIDKISELVYEHSGIPDLIEFSRAVHAEMDAIVSVARQGGVTTIDATLYTTTFPCHNCARHIVAAGIDTVYYIEPYEKSLALTSHSDAIVVLDHDADVHEHQLQSKSNTPKKVKFIHFSGVAPGLYAKFFLREKRKDDDGRFLEWNEDKDGFKAKIIIEFLDSYRDFETKVSQTFEEEFPTEIGPKSDQ